MDSKDQRRTFVFFETIHKHTHAIIPQLNAPIVKGRRQQGLSWMKCKPCIAVLTVYLRQQDSHRTLNAVAFRLEFREHYRHARKLAGVSAGNVGYSVYSVDYGREMLQREDVAERGLWPWEHRAREY